jgi:uncharacterized protein (DUF433 family)
MAKANKRNATTATTESKTVGLGMTKANTATNPTTADEVSERKFYDTVLDEVKYSDEDGFTIEDGEERMGLNPLDWLGYSITKAFVLHRDFLPQHLQDACVRLRRTTEPTKVLSVGLPLSHGERAKHKQTEVLVSPYVTSGDATIDDWRAEVVASLLTSLANGQREQAVANAFKALDENSTYGKYESRSRKTAIRTEQEHKPYRAYVATLFTGDLSTVGGTDADLTAATPYGALPIEDRQHLKVVSDLFDAVKEKHQFASMEKWLCAQCYALEMPTDRGIEVVYGEAIQIATAKSAKAGEKAVNSARVKYSRHAHDVFGWLLDEVESRMSDGQVPSGLEKWAEVVRKTRLALEAEVTLEECAVKYSLDKEVVANLRSKLDACPEQIIAYCEAVKERIEHERLVARVVG